MNPEYNNKEFVESIIGQRKHFSLGCIGIEFTGVVEGYSECCNEFILKIKEDRGFYRYLGMNSPNLSIIDQED